MIILGIDPGLQKTGWGIVRSEGSLLKFIACGLIKTNVADDLAQRLVQIHKELSHIVTMYRPDTAAIEETFMNNNAASALKLGQARGVAMAVPAILGVPVSEYAANLVKKSIVGTGHAQKGQMGMMIKVLLPSCGQIGEDEADALAVAITHAHHGQWNNIAKVLT